MLALLALLLALLLILCPYSTKTVSIVSSSALPILRETSTTMTNIRCDDVDFGGFDEGLR